MTPQNKNKYRTEESRSSYLTSEPLNRFSAQNSCFNGSLVNTTYQLDKLMPPSLKLESSDICISFHKSVDPVAVQRDPQLVFSSYPLLYVFH